MVPRILRSKAILPVVIVLVGALAFVALVKAKRTPERRTPPVPPPLVRVLEVQPEAIRLDVASQGQIAAATESELVAQVAGVVVDVGPALAAGGSFAKDEVLAVIDPRDFEIAVTNAQAGVARAEVILALQENEARIARRDWEALGEGEPDPLVLREPQVAEAHAARDAARAALQKARLDLDRTRIRAPFAGRVLRKSVDLGQFVAPGTPVARVYSTAAAELRLPIALADLAFVDLPGWGGDARADGSPGPPVSITAQVGGERRSWTGRIVRTEGALDPATRRVHAIARFENPEGAAGSGPPLAVGLFVEARIEGRLLEGAYRIPRSALRSGRDRVLIVDDEDRLFERDVTVVRLDGEHAIITAGLDPGDQLCLSPVGVVVEGMPVRIERPSPESGGVS